MSETTSTRPARAAVRSTRTREPRAVKRYTLDLDSRQHQFLRLFALQNDVEASKVCRALLLLLETDPTIADRVLDEIDPQDAPEG